MLEVIVPQNRQEHCSALTEQLLQQPLSDAGKESSALRAIRHHLQSGGGRTRSILVHEVSSLIGIDEGDAVILAAAVEALHNASLIQDDIIDADNHRRQQSACWQVFGCGVAICASDILITKAFTVCAQLSNAKKIAPCITLLGEAVERTVTGQCIDMDTNEWPALSPADYVNTVAQKSAPLIGLTATLPLVYQGLDSVLPRFNKVLTAFAAAYQIMDDLADWQEDAASGRCNIVLLYGVEQNPKRALLLSINHARCLLQQARLQLKEVPNIINSVIDARLLRLQNQLETFSQSVELS